MNLEEYRRQRLEEQEKREKDFYNTWLYNNGLLEAHNVSLGLSVSASAGGGTGIQDSTVPFSPGWNILSNMLPYSLDVSNWSVVDYAIIENNTLDTLDQYGEQNAVKIENSNTFGASLNINNSGVQNTTQYYSTIFFKNNTVEGISVQGPGQPFQWSINWAGSVPTVDLQSFPGPVVVTELSDGWYRFDWGYVSNSVFGSSLVISDAITGRNIYFGGYSLSTNNNGYILTDGAAVTDVQEYEVESNKGFDKYLNPITYDSNGNLI